MLQLTVSQSVCLGVEHQLGLMTRERHFTELQAFIIQPQHGPHRKRILHYCVLSRCRGNKLSTDLLHSNGRCTVAYLHSCYMAVGLHVTVRTSGRYFKTTFSCSHIQNYKIDSLHYNTWQRYIWASGQSLVAALESKIIYRKNFKNISTER
jgi:hypothetical protein